MFDCSKQILAFHDDEVKLSKSEEAEIRRRRDINRDRIRRGLNNNNKPLPFQFISQGSYAMKTMIRHPNNDYDIDDGVYFDKQNLVGPRGGEISALDARYMVCEAIHSDNFKRSPEYLKNCVRVYYREGYCVDVPIYRRVVAENGRGGEQVYFELASSLWRRSDARDVTKWFEKENKEKSPDERNGRQMRRICRLAKKFARSRDSWKSEIASGFLITKLVAECYSPHSGRDDESFFWTMANIYRRLSVDLIVGHPTTPNETITKTANDPKVRFFKDKTFEVISRLQNLFGEDCDYETAGKTWNFVFRTKYFFE